MTENGDSEASGTDCMSPSPTLIPLLAHGLRYAGAGAEIPCPEG